MKTKSYRTCSNFINKYRIPLISSPDLKRLAEWVGVKNTIDGSVINKQK